MTRRREEADELVRRTLDKIAEDDIASLVTDVLAVAWNGQRFDDAELMDGLMRLAGKEAAE